MPESRKKNLTVFWGDSTFWNSFTYFRLSCSSFARRSRLRASSSFAFLASILSKLSQESFQSFMRWAAMGRRSFSYFW